MFWSQDFDQPGSLSGLWHHLWWKVVTRVMPVCPPQARRWRCHIKDQTNKQNTPKIWKGFKGQKYKWIINANTRMIHWWGSWGGGERGQSVIQAIEAPPSHWSPPLSFSAFNWIWETAMAITKSKTNAKYKKTPNSQTVKTNTTFRQLPLYLQLSFLCFNLIKGTEKKNICKSLRFGEDEI